MSHLLNHIPSRLCATCPDIILTVRIQIWHITQSSQLRLRALDTAAIRSCGLGDSWVSLPSLSVHSRRESQLLATYTRHTENSSTAGRSSGKLPCNSGCLRAPGTWTYRGDLHSISIRRWELQCTLILSHPEPVADSCCVF
jgi:hypothetical protein